MECLASVKGDEECANPSLLQLAANISKEPKIYGEYKFPSCCHFWDAEGDSEERDNNEVPSEAQKSPEELEKKISETFFYNYEDVCSRPFVTEDSGIPINLLTLMYPFCGGCGNVKLRMFNTCSLNGTCLIWSGQCGISGTRSVETQIRVLTGYGSEWI